MMTKFGELQEMVSVYGAISNAIEHAQIAAVKNTLVGARHDIACHAMRTFGLRDGNAGHELLSLSADGREKFLTEWGRMNDMSGKLDLGI